MTQAKSIRLVLRTFAGDFQEEELFSTGGLASGTLRSLLSTVQDGDGEAFGATTKQKLYPSHTYGGST